MFRVLHIAIFMLIAQLAATAQFQYDDERKHINFSLGYLAILDLPSDYQTFQHGAHFGISTSLVNKYKIREQAKTSLNRIIDRDVYIKANIETYNRKDIHQALLFNVGPAFRITLPEGIFFEFEADVGYMRTFLNGNDFVLDGSDVVETKALGNNLVTIQAQAFIGWDFYKSNQYPVFLYVSGGLMTYFPNNNKWILQPTFQAGLGFVFMRIKETYQ